MSDEENKAFQYYKECNEKRKKQSKYLEILLNLIEKQSKEIEELKTEKAKRRWVLIKETGEVVPLFYVSEYKIKAKIEEIDKILERNLLDSIRYYFKAQKEALQSLLNEEK